jgi:hypothetical protein
MVRKTQGEEYLQLTGDDDGLHLAMLRGDSRATASTCEVEGIFGNHAAHIVSRAAERERVRKFFLEILGAELMRVREDADDIRLGDNFYMGILYGDHADESKFQRTGKSIWLELKSDNLEEMTRKWASPVHVS